MAVNTYRPRFSIVVYKTRQRADSGQPGRIAGGQAWDITGWLGDGSSVSVSKSVHRPMGSFVIQVPDQAFWTDPHAGEDMDTLYGLLEPLDEIEIRLARYDDSSAENLSVLMRGFIRDIRRNEVMSPDGKPNRIVVIQGNDYGLLFNITQIPPPPFWTALVGSGGFMTGLLPYQILGLDNQTHPVGTFLQSILTNLVNNQLATMGARFSQIPLMESPSPITGKMALPGIETMMGPIWNTMIRVADTPWNELFLEDTDAGPVLTFRVCPWHDTNGMSIQQFGQSSSTNTATVDISDVMHLDVARNDTNISNIFWVKGGGFETLLGLFNQVFQTGQAAGSIDETVITGTQAPNSDPDLYGYRYMEAETCLLPDNHTQQERGVKERDQKNNESAYKNWAQERRRGLIALNMDNVVFEHGRLVLKGNEQIRAGIWVQLQREKIQSEYYAATVTHDFSPYRHYTTTVEFVRGTGFIERARLDKPYLKEGKRGVY